MSAKGYSDPQVRTIRSLDASLSHHPTKLVVSVVLIGRAFPWLEKLYWTAANNLAIRRALEDAGVEFIDENVGGRREFTNAE